MPRLVLGLTLAVALPAAALAQDRLPDIPPAQYNADQQKAADAFEAKRKVPLSGPFLPMMYSPEVMTAARELGDHLRYHSAVGNTLSEFAILVTAREWSQDYEWSVHAPIAQTVGIEAGVIAAVREGRRPEGMSADETIVYDFATELMRNKQVSDATYRRAEQRFGKPGVVDLVGLVGYYTLDAMMLNAARFPSADGTTLPRFPGG